MNDSDKRLSLVHFFFFFNDTAPTEIYTLSLHDALPILSAGSEVKPRSSVCSRNAGRASTTSRTAAAAAETSGRASTAVRILPHTRPSPLDARTQPGERRRQDGYRARNGDQYHEHRAHPDGGEDLGAGEQHAGHRDHDRGAGDEHGLTGGRRRNLQRRTGFSAGSALLS